MDLILWRHADAENGSHDSERKLTAKGIKQAARMAKWLRARLSENAVVLASPAKRAQQTARALTADYRTVMEIGTSASVKDVLIACGWPGDERAEVVVVGHQPTLDWSDGLHDFLAQDELLACFDGIADHIAAVAQSGDRFERLVLRWCLENAIPLRAQPSSDVHLIKYERLRDDPAPELERLFAYLGEPSNGALHTVGRPSKTADFARRGGRVEIDDRRRRRAQELLELFELGALELS
jgi:phosphohistidine phosphatase SixA